MNQFRLIQRLSAMVLVIGGLCSFALAASSVSATNDPQARDDAESFVAKPRSDITGKWSSNWGPVKIQCGTRDESGVYPVTGSWIQGPNMHGEIVSGTFDPKSGVFRFRFDEPWHDQTGTAELKLSEDDSTLFGTWQFKSGGGGGWTMKQD
jgi:hypothetical protein